MTRRRSARGAVAKARRSTGAASAKRELWCEALEASDPIITEFNEKYAVVLIGSLAVIMREDRDTVPGRSVIYLTSRKDLELFYANRPRVAGGDGKPISQVAFWLCHPDRRTYYFPGLRRALRVLLDTAKDLRERSP